MGVGMKPLFSRSSNNVLRVVIVLLVFGAVGTPVLLMAWVRTPLNLQQNDPIDQPIQFDHRHHVADDGIDCRYCHTTVERSDTAGLPATSVCMGCHGQIWNQATLIEPMRQSWQRKQPIVWNRVHELPDFVYFNHSAHINKGVGCATCHGRVDQMARVYKVQPLTMQWCLDCHRNPAPNLRPADKITDMTWQPAGPEVGLELMKQNKVNPPTYCSGCHR